MARMEMTKLDARSSIELFITHWKYGHNYEDSTVLVDKGYNIIAFFDRATENIDIVMADLPFNDGWIVADGKKVDMTGQDKIQYISYDYNRLRSNHKEIMKTPQFKNCNAKELWAEMLEKQKRYNVEYFTRLINEIGQ